ncbi:MAG: hypothetical protein Q9M37_05630 [Desulfonauticus sp.]|nr:hypothetical protein [Desulfonauticus sp.]
MKKLLILKPKTSINQRRPRNEFDLVEMPLEGVVVYWLSLAKLFSKSVLEQEIKLTSEPYINYLLRLLQSKIPPEDCLSLAKVKMNSFLRDLEKKLILMAISVLGMATRENPQKVMIRFISKYPLAPIYEQEILKTAKKFVLEFGHQDEVAKKKFLNIDHRLNPEKLMLNLIIYNCLERKYDISILQKCMQYINSVYFAEGLALIIDNFDYDFIKHRLNLQKNEIIFHTKNKMLVSAELCFNIKKKMKYVDLSLVAQAYL